VPPTRAQHRFLQQGAKIIFAFPRASHEPTDAVDRKRRHDQGQREGGRNHVRDGKINRREFRVRRKQREHQNHENVGKHVRAGSDCRRERHPRCPRRQQQKQRKRSGDNLVEVRAVLEIRPGVFRGKIRPHRDHDTDGQRADQPAPRLVGQWRAVLRRKNEQ